MFRRADLLISAGKFDEAILQLQDVHDGYPTFDKRPLCAFLVAFIYDEHLKDRELAVRAYERTMASIQIRQKPCWPNRAWHSFLEGLGVRCCGE